MHSKKPLYCLGIIVVVFICVLAVFLGITGSVSKTAMDVNLTGNWRILIKDNSPASADSGLCFDGTQMTYTPGNGEKITDTYEMNEKGFSLTNLKLSFTIAKKTDNLLKLSGSDGRVWYVLRVSEQPKLITPVQMSLDGEWDVVVHGNSIVSETMIVKQDRVTFYKDSTDAPYFSDTFIWSDTNVLSIEKLQMTMNFYPLNETTCTMVEGDKGLGWEIHRK